MKALICPMCDGGGRVCGNCGISRGRGRLSRKNLYCHPPGRTPEKGERLDHKWGPCANCSGTGLVRRQQ